MRSPYISGMAEFLSSLSRRARGFLPRKWRSDAPMVPVVRLSGAIGMASPFSRSM